MGLCRCPKRKVTTQFCYEHRVNVCDNCMVEDHPNCIVQGYLQWLKDSDYEPLCTLCRKELIQFECIRLLCYHVFHWRCLDEHLLQLPSNTAPAGFTCPTCGHEVIPRENVGSPVATVIREKLQRAQWGVGDREANKGFQYGSLVDKALDSTWSITNPSVETSSLSYTNEGMSNTTSRNSFTKQHLAPGQYGEVQPSTRSFVTQPLLRVDEDDKYKRKSIFELANRWFQSKLLLGVRRRDPTRKWAAVSISAFIFLLLIVYLMSRLGRSSADANKFLDPESNPNLQIK